MSSCPFRRQKSSSRLLEKSANDAPVRQESMGLQNEEEEDTQTLNIKVLNEAVRLLTEPGVSAATRLYLTPSGRRGRTSGKLGKSDGARPGRCYDSLSKYFGKLIRRVIDSEFRELPGRKFIKTY
ncbi:UNVERIFIED_CONTAM: hypothetical protein PYX00_006020 [Menopon gallinae]|uniref:Uncharacterized protein n=1 Tax=Menopon gallinae TaxID=328185 RepID=A0AAW2HTQ9_9NEOP